MKLKSKETCRAAAVWRLLAKDTKLSRFVTDRDCDQFKRRLEAEGVSFLTVVLPALGKALDQSFQTGQFELPMGWKPAKECVYPSFLRTAWETLFDKNGVARWHVADEHGLPVPALACGEYGCAVLALRQLTMTFYKLEHPVTKEQSAEVCQRFLENERAVAYHDSKLQTSLLSREQKLYPWCLPSLDVMVDRARSLISRLLSKADPQKISPCYGTGATACKATPWGRWEKPRLIPKLDAVYPVSEWFFSGLNGLESNLLDNQLDLETCEDPPARGVFVPKDSRGPRFISAEPREYMYIQQGVRKDIEYEMNERYPMVAAMISTDDQMRQQVLACIGSMTGSIATLDLKDASDMLSWQLVQMLFPSNWVEAFDSCRSTATVLPDGTLVPLAKFAPMGSACCFPVETIVFWAIAMAAHPHYYRFHNKIWRRNCANVDIAARLWSLTDHNGPPCSVFGDDIIVGSAYAASTVEALEMFGLTVNHSKSFSTGPFRESCGGDYFYGVNVAPVRVKRGLRGDGVGDVFQVKDLLNRISLIYGDTCPTLVRKLRELTYEFYGYWPELVAVNHQDGTSACLLIDYHWGQNEPGSTPLYKIKGKRSRALSYAGIKRRTLVRNKSQNDFNRLERRVLVQVPEEEQRDLGWSSVLRSFHLSGGRGGTDIYAYRKRVSYKLAWV